MGPAVLGLLAIAGALLTPPDTLPSFATPETRELVERAMARHRAADSLVHDYQARLRYRFSFALGRRAWARLPTAAVEEQEARLQWQRPNDVRIDILGRRFASRREDVRFVSAFDEPWFVPRSLGDSLRVFGSDFPERAALHPLAAGGPDQYRYEIVDSVSLATQGGPRLRLVAVEVTPRRTLPAAVAGRIWIERGSAEVVRLTMRFLGTDLWVLPDAEEDRSDKDARRANRIINRVFQLSADLEYALQDGRYWMPYRQVINAKIQVPVVSDIVIPVTIVTTFDDYEINRGQAITWDVALPDSSQQRRIRRERRDSLQRERDGRSEAADRPERLPAVEYAGYWTGGRFQVRRPPGDSLTAYGGWGDTLQLDLSPGDAERIRDAEIELQRLAAGIDGSMTGQPRFAFGYERAAELVRYNRVTGVSLGASYRWLVPGRPFTSVYPSARYGFSDGRLYARLSVVQDAPSGRWSLSGYRDLRDVDPVSPGLTLGNSIRGIFLARDDGEYYLAEGAQVGYETSLGVGTELTLRAAWENQATTPTEAVSGVNDFLGGDGLFPPNAAVEEGGHVLAGGKVEWTRGRHRVAFSADGLTGQGTTTGRFWAQWRGDWFGRDGLTVRAKAGIATNPDVPQMQFRLGGVNTVRGLQYATARGQAFWAAQVDYALSRNVLRPVLWADLGQAARPDGFGDARLVGAVGGGLSLLGGWMRLDLGVPINPSGGVRLDLVFGMPR